MFESLYNHYGWTYDQAFAWMFAGTAMVYGSIALAVTLLLYYLNFFIKKSYDKNSDYHKVHDDTEAAAAKPLWSESHENIEGHIQEADEAGPSKNKALAVKVLDVLTILASWWALLAWAIFPSVLSGLGVIPIPVSMLITLAIFAVKYFSMIYYYSPNFLNKMTNQQSNWFARFGRRIVVTMGMNKVIFGLYIGFAFAYVIIVPLITADTCLDFFNYGYGSKFQDFGLSTRFSRYLQLDTVCPQGEICQLYVTLPEDGSTQAIINVHTGTDIKSLKINYDVLSKLDKGKIDAGVPQALASTQTARSFYIDLETRGARYVHSAFLSGLTPNTEYYLEVSYNEKAQANATYLTLPSKAMERDVVLAAGGDAGTTLMARQMTEVIGNYPVDAIIIGGDLAYDNGIRACYYSIDLFLDMFKPVNKKLGRLVPYITSIGNHDIGFNAFQDGKVDISRNLYMIYFPLHGKKENGKVINEVPDLHERLSYNYHLVGNTIQMCLDSAYLEFYDGPQKQWIIDTSEAHKDYIKMANFHVPIYPACFNELYDDRRTWDHPKEHWVPLFEKYSFASIFENHVHLYKASYPLNNGTENGKGQKIGVMYFGDGNWGIQPDICYPKFANGNETGLLDAYSDVTHVWFININKETLSHYAVNVTGQMFGKYYNLTAKHYLDDEL